MEPRSHETETLPLDGKMEAISSDGHSPFFTELKCVREDLVLQALRQDPTLCHHQDQQGRTVLHWAAEYGYYKLAQHVLNNSEHAPCLSSPDLKGLTPLHIACNAKREDFASLFITLGAEVNLADQAGNTPLHRAVRANLQSIVSLLCERGADVNAKNEFHWTPLHEAARTGNVSILEILIKHGADPNAVTANKMTPFLTAFFFYKIASKGNSYANLDVVWKLLIESGCCLSQSDGHWSPLTAALASDNSFIAALLLFNGCRLDKTGRLGRGLLQEAFACSEPMLVKLVVLLGYIPSPDEITYCGKQLPMYSKVLTRLVGLGAGLHKERHEVVKWLRERGQQPPSLLELSRVSIRQAMNEAAQDRSILNNIGCLPIPTRLKEFVGLSDFTHYLCE